MQAENRRPGLFEDAAPRLNAAQREAVTATGGVRARDRRGRHGQDAGARTPLRLPGERAGHHARQRPVRHVRRTRRPARCAAASGVSRATTTPATSTRSTASACRCCRRTATRCSTRRAFSCWTTPTSMPMLQVICEARGLTLRDMTFSKARDMIEIMKLKERPGYYRDMLAMPLEGLRQKYLDAMDARDIIFYGYLYQEKKCFGLDYNDLIVFVLYLFEQNSDIRLKWQKRLEYIMVDEFQDIDGLPARAHGGAGRLPARTCSSCATPTRPSTTWRGADVRYLLDFDKRFPGTRTVMMLENYRSAPRVVAVANSLIEKKPRATCRSGWRPCARFAGPTVWRHAKSPDDEAAWIAQGALALHGEGVAYRDMAVLYRARCASRPVEEALLRAEVPHAVYSGVPFFGRREIKDALSYLRLVALSGRPRLRARGERAQAQPGRPAHGVSAREGRRAGMRACSRRWASSASWTTICSSARRRASCCSWSTSLPLVVRRPAGARGSGGRAVEEKRATSERCAPRGRQERLRATCSASSPTYVRTARRSRRRAGRRWSLEHYLAHTALLTNADAMDGLPQDKVRLHDRPCGQGPRVRARVPLLDDRGRARRARPTRRKAWRRSGGWRSWP